MPRSSKNTAIHRKLVTQNYRGEFSHMKGLMLLEELDIFITEAAEAVSLSHTLIYRAIRTREEERELGINGRFQIFNKEDSEELLRPLYTLRETTPLTKNHSPK